VSCCRQRLIFGWLTLNVNVGCATWMVGLVSAAVNWTVAVVWVLPGAVGRLLREWKQGHCSVVVSPFNVDVVVGEFWTSDGDWSQ
jgi:hypothetical protein